MFGIVSLEEELEHKNQLILKLEEEVSELKQFQTDYNLITK